MMKRIVGLIAAVLMMCSAALAENAQKLSMTIEADAEAVKTALALEDEQAELADSVCLMLNGLELQATIQEDGGYAQLLANGETLIDMGITSRYATSSLLPKHYVKMETDEAMAEAAALEDIDWAPVAVNAFAAVDSWFGKLDFTREEGAFSCDAYADAAVMYTASFEEKDVAALADELLDCLPEAAKDFLNTGRWSVMNANVAEKNAYCYVLKRAYAADNETLLGLTLQVMQENDQVMRYSLGFADNGVRLVWAYGLNGLNHFMDVMLLDGASPDEKEFMLAVYQDPERVGFAGVDQQYERLAVMYTGVIRMTQQEGGSDWRVEMEVFEPAALLADMLFVLEGGMDETLGLMGQTLAFYVPVSENEWTMLAALRMDMAPGERAEISLEGLTELDLETTEDMTTFEGLMEEASLKLMVKLFKIVPTELITFLME